MQTILRFVLYCTYYALRIMLPLSKYQIRLRRERSLYRQRNRTRDQSERENRLASERHARGRKQSRLLFDQQLTDAERDISQSPLNSSQQNPPQGAVQLWNISRTEATGADQFPRISQPDEINVAANSRLLAKIFLLFGMIYTRKTCQHLLFKRLEEEELEKKAVYLKDKEIFLNIQLKSTMMSVRCPFLAALVALSISTQRDFWTHHLQDLSFPPAVIMVLAVCFL